MKISHTLKTITMLSALLTTSAIYADTTPVSDADITSAIQSKFSTNKITSDLHVTVTSQAGDVKLAGNVNTDNEASKLIELADSVNGVKDVDTNELTVQKSKHPLADSVITAKIKGEFVRDKLFGDKDIAVMDMKVVTTNGVVYLTGTVENKDEMDNAVKVAQSVSGVKKVDSKLTVKTVQ